MSIAQVNDRVRIHFTGKLKDGSVFASSEGGDPLELTIGERRFLTGVEDAIAGMEVGQEKTETIPAQEAFGTFQDELVIEVEKTAFPKEADVVPGKQFETTDNKGASRTITVVDVNDETVTVDANHPLAGKDLVFDIKLLEIL
jgi:peptidylprolyl isomerase